MMQWPHSHGGTPGTSGVDARYPLRTTDFIFSLGDDSMDDPHGHFLTLAHEPDGDPCPYPRSQSPHQYDLP